MSQVIESNAAIAEKKLQSQQQRKRPYYAFRGDEIAAIIARAIGDRVYEVLMANNRLSSDILAFPHPKLNFHFELLQFPHGENRKIIVEGLFDVPDLETIPPDAVRVLNDLPLTVEEKPKNSPTTGLVDGQKTADQIDPKMKSLVDKQYGALNPVKSGIKATIGKEK